VRRATLTALILVTGVALAQNPFRDLAPAPEPEEAPAANTPITIDIPASQLPTPPLNVDGFPALPAPGALGGDTPSGSAGVTATAPTVNVPDEPVVFALPALPDLSAPDALHVALRNPLHAPSAASAKPLLEPLPTPEVASEQPTEAPEAAGEEPVDGSVVCADAAVLATSGGHTPTALLRCGGATHLLRVGDTIPGTDATIQSIDTLGVTITREGQGRQLHLAAQ